MLLICCHEKERLSLSLNRDREKELSTETRRDSLFLNLLICNDAKICLERLSERRSRETSLFLVTSNQQNLLTERESQFQQRERETLPFSLY